MEGNIVLTDLSVWTSLILLNKTSRHLGKRPGFEDEPFIVKVFPDPVIPYMKIKPEINNIVSAKLKYRKSSMI